MIDWENVSDWGQAGTNVHHAENGSWHTPGDGEES